MSQRAVWRLHWALTGETIVAESQIFKLRHEAQRRRNAACPIRFRKRAGNNETYRF